MEGGECGRGKRLKRVIVCRNGWHNCCLAAFEKGSSCASPSKSSPVKYKDEARKPTVLFVETQLAARANEPEAEKDKYEGTLCEECGRGDGEQEMLLCDRCDRGFHMFCLCPIVVIVPQGNWFCPNCSQSAHVRRTFFSSHSFEVEN